MPNWEAKEPIYEKKAVEIIEAFKAGGNEEEIAQQFGYSNFKSLSNYMRRKNFSWNGSKGNFFPAKSKQASKSYPVQFSELSRAEKIVALFAEGEFDAKEIAEKMEFNSHRDIAEFMEEKGYQWDSELGNYARLPDEDGQASTHMEEEGSSSNNDSDFKRYLPLLELLEENEAQLKELLGQAAVPGQMPRYLIRGKANTRSVYMTTALDGVIKDFSKNNNISQREIFEAAIIELLKKHGYQKEINRLLSS